jgi:hypothetical protein
MGVVSLIVMEPGSRWPGHVRGSENIVAASHVGEEGLLKRTQRTLARLLQGGQHVRVAVLACSDATDAAALACRAELARVLLAAVADTGFGRLVLSSAKNTTVPLRRELLSLAAALNETALGTSVRVRFDDAPGELPRVSR